MVIAIVFRIRRAAVHAAKIATIRDGDPQIGDLPSELVVKRHVYSLNRKNKNPIRVNEIGRRPK
jgi:hypothetical protein